MATVLLGKPIADAILASVSAVVSACHAEGKDVKIATIRVGDRPDDLAYERSISRACERCGIELATKVFDEDASTEELIAEVNRVNSDDGISGCLVFQPMPPSIDGQAVCNAIDPSKDLDCASDASLGDVMLGNKDSFAPSTAEAVIKVCDHYGIDLDGSSVVVVGRSRVIGKPVGLLALDKNATVTFCHSATRDLASFTREADIVICAVGKAAFFDESHFREGQCVIDVGMNVDSEGRLCGDVAFDKVEPIVGSITPVPGGVGAITTSVLLEHAIRRFANREAKEA